MFFLCILNPVLFKTSFNNQHYIMRKTNKLGLHCLCRWRRRPSFFSDNLVLTLLKNFFNVPSKFVKIRNGSKNPPERMLEPAAVFGGCELVNLFMAVTVDLIKPAHQGKNKVTARLRLFKVNVDDRANFC